MPAKKTCGYRQCCRKHRSQGRGCKEEVGYREMLQHIKKYLLHRPLLFRRTTGCPNQEPVGENKLGILRTNMNMKEYASDQSRILVADFS